MAENRKSAKQTAARKAARERAAQRAAEFRRRQEQLEELAVEYFVAVDAVAGIEAGAEERIAVIRAEAEQQVAASRAEAAAIIGQMLDTKVTRDEVAERLGLPVREVKRTKRDKPTASNEAVAASRNEADAGPSGEHHEGHHREDAAA